jgi:hypothetical protein
VKKDDRIQNVQELICFLYDGAKVANEKKKKGNRTKAAAAIAAFVAAGVAGAVILSGREKGSGALQETLTGTIVAANELASDGYQSAMSDTGASSTSSSSLV